MFMEGDGYGYLGASKGNALSVSAWFVVHSNCISLCVCFRVSVPDSSECTQAQIHNFVL